MTLLKPEDINKQKVVLLYQCNYCERFFNCEVDTINTLGETVMEHASRQMIHRCGHIHIAPATLICGQYERKI